MGPIILLTLLGIILMLLEIFILTGFGFAGLLSILSMGAACYLAFANYGTLVGSIVLFLIVVALAALVFVSLRAKTWKKATLNTEIDAKVDTMPEKKGLKQGDCGITTTQLNPMGRVRFSDGTEVEVHSIDGMIAVKSDVVIDSIDNEKIFVKKI